MKREGAIKGRRGFTLVELMIVVVLMAVLAAISAPTISQSVERNRISDLNRQVANGFAESRSFAMSRGQVVFADIVGQEIIFSLPANFDLGEATSCVSAVPGGVELFTVDIGSFGVDMEIQNVDPAGLTRVCMSPSGRILDENGAIIRATGGNCDDMNFVLRVSGPNAPASLLNQCPSDSESDADSAMRQIHNIYNIHVAYSGQIRVMR